MFTRDKISKDKRPFILMLMLAFLLLIALVSFFVSGDAPVSDEAVSDEVVSEQSVADVVEGALSMRVIDPIAIPVLNDEQDYLGNIFTKVTVHYLIVDGNDRLAANLENLTTRFARRLAVGDLFQENTSILDLAAAGVALKYEAEQIVGESYIQGVTVEESFHQDP